MVSAPAEHAGWFDRVPAIIELSDFRVPGYYVRHDPTPYMRARSWPAGWAPGDRRGDVSDPVGGWRHAADQSAGRADGASDSVRVDIGPHAMAFAGTSFLVDRAADGFEGTVTSFTDESTNGSPFERTAPVVGRIVSCPSTRAYDERKPAGVR